MATIEELEESVKASREANIELAFEVGTLNRRLASLEKTLSAIKTQIGTAPLTPVSPTPVQAASGLVLPVNSMNPVTSQPLCR